MAARSLQTLADAAADRYGIPRDLYRRLIRQESGWNPDASNPSGATGIVQIHLPSHPDITEEQAKNPAFALDWGARYLRGQFDRFGKWGLALAAYNAGPGNVEKYNGIPPFAETQRYVRNILGGGSPAAAPSASGVQRQPPPRTTPTRTPASTSASDPRRQALLGYLLGQSPFEDVLKFAAAPEQPQQAPAAPVPGIPAATPPQPSPTLGGLSELFYDPRGSYNDGRFGGPIGGHDTHLHASVTKPQAMLALIRLAQKRGYRVSENPYVDKVDPVHTEGSYHYRKFPGLYGGRQLGQGVDISGGDLGSLYDLVLGRFGVKR